MTALPSDVSALRGVAYRLGDDGVGANTHQEPPQVLVGGIVEMGGGVGRIGDVRPVAGRGAGVDGLHESGQGAVQSADLIQVDGRFAGVKRLAFQVMGAGGAGGADAHHLGGNLAGRPVGKRHEGLEARRHEPGETHFLGAHHIVAIRRDG